MRKAITFLPAILVAGLLAAPAFTASKDHDHDATKQEKKESKDTEKIQDAEGVIKASVSAPDKGIPKNLLEKAGCVGGFREVKKGALVVGGTGGKGIFTCRNGKGMSAPAFFNLGGPSVGW